MVEAWRHRKSRMNNRLPRAVCADGAGASVPVCDGRRPEREGQLRLGLVRTVFHRAPIEAGLVGPENGRAAFYPPSVPGALVNFAAMLNGKCR